MKKWLVVLSLVMVVLFLGCSSSGGDDDDAEDWMFASWLIDTDAPDADTAILKVKSDHTWIYYTDYAETTESASGTFSVDGDTFTYKGDQNGSASFTKESNDHWIWTDDKTGEVTDYYRKSAYPEP